MTPRRGARLVAALLLVLGARPVKGQGSGSTTVVPLQPLTFGNLIPGVPEVVSISDVARRAVIALSGSSAVDVTLLLPASMEAPDGTSIPLQFGSADGAVMASTVSAPVPMNPHESRRVALAPDHATHLILGGVALPTRSQRPGHYTARVIVLISQPGT